MNDTPYHHLTPIGQSSLSSQMKDFILLGWMFDAWYEKLIVGISLLWTALSLGYLLFQFIS
jgi:hypothetical protein